MIGQCCCCGDKEVPVFLCADCAVFLCADCALLFCAACDEGLGSDGFIICAECLQIRKKELR